jgi:hypothetical protein
MPVARSRAGRKAIRSSMHPEGAVRSVVGPQRRSHGWPHVRSWPGPEATLAAGVVRCVGSTCRQRVGPDPPLVTHLYGPAVRRKRVSSSCQLCGLASMYPASVWSVCSGPPWISARMRSHYRPGLKWAIWVTRVHMRREDRSSISSHPLADLGGKRDMLFHDLLLLIGAVPLFVPGGRSSVPACS